MAEAKELSIPPTDSTEWDASIIEKAPILVVEIDREGHILLINEKFTHLTQYDKKRLIGENFFSLLVPSIYKSDISRIKSILSGTGNGQFLLPILNKSGSEHLISWSCVNAGQNNGTHDHIFLFGQNIEIPVSVSNHQHQSYGDFVKYLTQNHYFSNCQGCQFLSDSADAIVIIDTEDKIQLWNKGAESTFKYTAEEMIGHSFKRIIPMHLNPDAEMKKIARMLESKGYIKNYIADRVTKDGKVIKADITRTPIYDMDGNLVGGSVIIRDVTENIMVQNQMAHQEKMASMGLMAAGIAHEIGNPLSAISAIVQVAQRKAKDTTLHDEIHLIRNHVERIQTIVREMVDFAKPPSYEAKNTIINEIIQAAINISKYDPRAKNLTIQQQLQAELPTIHIVPDQILQVFINILINAMDAVDPDKGVIHVHSYLQDGNIIIDFQDNGVGIPTQDLQKIFEPFYTSKPIGHGTGLGLSVSYGIIQTFQGEITVQSELGKGSCFTVKLPVQRKGKSV